MENQISFSVLLALVGAKTCVATPNQQRLEASTTLRSNNLGFEKHLDVQR